jgi:hypothetical protein
MSAQVSADVRALFDDLGVAFADSPESTGLVIDRFELWEGGAGNGGGPVRVCFCRVDELEAA